MGLLLKKGNSNKPSEEAQQLLQGMQQAADTVQNCSPDDDDALAYGMVEV